MQQFWENPKIAHLIFVLEMRTFNFFENEDEVSRRKRRKTREKRKPRKKKENKREAPQASLTITQKS